MRNFQSIHSSRLIVFLFPVLFVLLFVYVVSFVFESNAAADVETEAAYTAEDLDEFSAADPFVCLIPDDGGILPCHANLIADEIPIQRSAVTSVTNELCTTGEAAGFPCKDVDLLAHLPLSYFNNVRASDIWGWTDPETGAEIVIMTQRDQVAFVDISDPINPEILGFLPKPATANSSAWRDVKTYGNYAYIVGDIAADYGMQIFDLTRLRTVTETTTFEADTRYQGVKSTHNIVINEQTGLAALVGVSLGDERCNGGMHLLDLEADALNPPFVGCVSEDGYVHDAQCVIYHGPDAAYQGQEVCFNFNTTAVTIVDVTDRSAPEQLSRTVYQQSAYTHQGWVTADHRYLLVDDESDETKFDINTTTLIFDISDLNSPSLIDTYTADTAAIDHNQYVQHGYSFQANYRAGLRILDAADVASGVLEEVAYFDIYPADDDAKFNAAWSSYPYFESGVVPLSGVEQGLFLLRPSNLQPYRAEVDASESISVLAGSTITHLVSIKTIGADDTYDVTLESNGLNATINGSAMVQGSANAPSTVELNLPIPPFTDRSYSLTVRFESRQRDGYVVSKTLEIESLLDPFYAADLMPSGDATVGDDLLTHSFEIENHSNLADQYQINVTSDSWDYALSSNVSDLVPVTGKYKFVITGTIEAVGTESNYTVTIQSINEPSLSQTFSSSYLLNVGAIVNFLDSQSGLPGERLTTTLIIENRGEASDRFDVVANGGRWSNTLSAPRTVLLAPGESDEIGVEVVVGEAGANQLEFDIISVRSGQLVAERVFESVTYSSYMPSIFR